MSIPYPSITQKAFHERLTLYEKKNRIINGNLFEFVIEETRSDTSHACTVDDCAEILRHISPMHYGRLNLIIFRQPKRKEEILSPVWGRLIYSYNFENQFRPAIILEAINLDKVIKWPKSLPSEYQKELNRLIEDGHLVQPNKRYYTITSSLKAIRATQLYRTLPHELGHYKHFLEEVGEIEDSPDSESYEDYEHKEENYHKMKKDIKEKYAHRFADTFRKKMREVKIIPFERIEEQKKF